MSSGGGQTQTTNPEVPAELKGAANSYSQIATNVANKPFTPYGGVGVADMNPLQLASIGKTASLSGYSPIQAQTEGALAGYLGGSNSNPYLDSMIQRAQNSVKANMIGSMVGSGSYGNSGIEEATGRALADTASSMYGNAYNTDQANRLSAIQLSPTVQNSAYLGANQLMQAGNALQNNEQNKADFAYQQYQNQQNYPLMQLSAIGGALNNMKGQVTTTTGSGK